MGPLTRRTVLKNAATACAATPGLNFCASRRRPNILFIMTDDQAAGQMSCEGGRIIQTPNLDRLAREGVYFANNFCTNSLCAPGRATVLTGAYSHVNGIRGNSEAAAALERLDPNLATYPRVLQQSGYRTAMIGKWHLPQDPAGFDYWCVLPGQGVYFDPEFIEMGERRKRSGYVTDIVTDMALDWLKRQTNAGPFCLVWQHKAPHRPFTPPKRHAKLLDGVALPKPPTYDDDYATRRVAAEARDMKFEFSLAGDYPDLPPDLSPAGKKDWIFDRFVKDHYRSLYGVDENLGRVLDYLDESGLAEDTLVLYTSDNGFYLGEHGWYDKRFMYEPSLRVPLLVRYPRLRLQGRVATELTQNIDYAPTMLDLAGVPVPSTMQGRSLRPILEGAPPADWRASVYYAYWENSWQLRDTRREEMRDPTFAYFTAHRVGPHRGVRTGRHKLIEFYSEGDYWELFDLEKDPHELNNLYGQPGYADLTAELKRELARLREQYGDV
jgi:arylsulfatase A-like enzyme